MNKPPKTAKSIWIWHVTLELEEKADFKGGDVSIWWGYILFVVCESVFFVYQVQLFMYQMVQMDLFSNIAWK